MYESRPTDHRTARRCASFGSTRGRRVVAIVNLGIGIGCTPVLGAGVSASHFRGGHSPRPRMPSPSYRHWPIWCTTLIATWLPSSPS